MKYLYRYDVICGEEFTLTLLRFVVEVITPLFLKIKIYPKKITDVLMTEDQHKSRTVIKQNITLKLYASFKMARFVIVSV